MYSCNTRRVRRPHEELQHVLGGVARRRPDAKQQEGLAGCGLGAQKCRQRRVVGEGGHTRGADRVLWAQAPLVRVEGGRSIGSHPNPLDPKLDFAVRVSHAEALVRLALRDRGGDLAVGEGVGLRTAALVGDGRAGVGVHLPHVSVSDSSRVVAETAAGRPSSYTHVVPSPKSAFIALPITLDQLALPGHIIMATSERKVHSVLSVGSGNMVSGWNWIAGGGRPVGTRVP